MKSNTQNAKIEAITEKTLVLGIDVGSEMHYAELLITEESSIRRSHLSLVTQRPDLRHLRNGSWTSKKGMRRIRWFRVWNRPGITGSILESFYRIMK